MCAVPRILACSCGWEQVSPLEPGDEAGIHSGPGDTMGLVGNLRDPVCILQCAECAGGRYLGNESPIEGDVGCELVVWLRPKSSFLAQYQRKRLVGDVDSMK